LRFNPSPSSLLLGVLACTLSQSVLHAQGTLADYQRAHDLRDKAFDLIVNVPGEAHWIGDEHRFWYARSVKGGNEYELVDADAGTKRPAFDQEKLAVAISSATGQHYTALTLPFAPVRLRPGSKRPDMPKGKLAPLKFLDNERTIEFGLGGSLFRCTLADAMCVKVGPIPDDPHHNHEMSPEDISGLSPEVLTELDGGDPVGGIGYTAPAPGADEDDANAAEGEEHWQRPCATKLDGAGEQSRGDDHRERGSAIPGQQAELPHDVCRSFDGRFEAFIQNFNVYLKAKGEAPAYPISFDGTENDAYTFGTLAWSPDSKKLAGYHVRPGFDRLVTYVESSPVGQIQPKTKTEHYVKPGDPVDTAWPVLFDVETKQAIQVDHGLFPNPFSLSEPVWWKDSRGFTFEYNQRGHQAYTVVEVNAKTGTARPIVAETTKTFFYYNDLEEPGLSAGRRYRHDVDDGKEIIWASERDGWEHLYLYDGLTGAVKNQITKGEWLVRHVDYVDDKNRQIWFEAGGSMAGQDPYFTQFYRINFDGTGLTRLTDADGMHTASFSHDRKFYVDSWQRVDLAPVAQLRRTLDQKVVLELDKGDTTALLAAGLRAPEVFVAKGRDGKTDIWGTITRPLRFDPKKKYPVIENIYAGPQGSFVPKTFSAIAPDQALAELGFIVVHIDGMGTSNRSKAFHDVAFKDLADAGLPDRILWHRAVAAKYPSYDITRVGIFGTSAGGQSSLGALLFHPEFYKVAVTNSGCHDNRMDKMWWNEQWMSWPVGPQYAASSNVDHAYRLQGKVLIVIGELDTNVDPASSLQVVNALVQAHKHFDMLYIPGQNHGVGILSDEHYRDDYFVHNLLGVEPPDWNKVALTVDATGAK
jgi:dipeptidyl aminopeptidase/acylaminoacyl peptidase